MDSFVRRPWNERYVSVLDQRLSRPVATDASERVVMLNCFCGSGKTLGLIDGANICYRRGLIDFILVFTPRVNLCRQYEESWEKNNGSFNGKKIGRICHNRNTAPLVSNDMFGGPQHGVIATYAGLAAQPKLYLDFCKQHRVFLILDEAQILGVKEDESGTRASEIVRQLVPLCPITSLATGTAFRSDGGKLLFGKYSEPDTSGKMYLQADVEATYSEGVAHQYLRKIDFVAAHDGEVWKKYLDEDEPEKIVLSEQRSGLRDIYRQESIWAPIVDRTADEIRGQRKVDRRWKSIFGACDQNHAREIHKYLCRRHSDMEWSVAVSDDDNSLGTLEAFKKNRHAGLVSVQMCYVGYDNPWITKVAILNHFRFIGWLDQFAFRGGRVISDIPYDDQTLQVIGGADPLVLEWFRARRADQELGLKEKKEGVAPTLGPRRDFVVTDGKITGVISMGYDSKHDLTDVDQDKLERLVRSNDWFDLSLAMRVRLFRDWEAAGNPRLGRNPEDEPFQSYDDRLRHWKSRLHEINRRFCGVVISKGNPESWNYGYSAVYAKFGIDSTDKAGISDLQQYCAYLEGACNTLRKEAV